MPRFNVELECLTYVTEYEFVEVEAEDDLDAADKAYDQLVFAYDDVEVLGVDLIEE